MDKYCRGIQAGQGEIWGEGVFVLVLVLVLVLEMPNDQAPMPNEEGKLPFWFSVFVLVTDALVRFGIGYEYRSKIR